MKARLLFLFAGSGLCLLGGCLATKPGGPDPNNSVAAAQPPGDGSSSDSPGGTPAGGGAGTGGGGSSSSGGGASAFSGCNFDLQGFWREGGGSEIRYVAIDHVGPSVISTFLAPAICNHRDGTGTTSTTEDDWIGTVTDCEITGTIQLCQYGCTDECTNGWVDSQSFSATVSADGQQITGHWVGTDGSEGDVTLTRMSCQPRLPGDFGLQDTAQVQWARDEVTFQTPPDPNVGLAIQLRPADGEAPSTPTPFDAGFDGAVLSVSPADQTNLTNLVVVELRDGTQVSYDFKGQILVATGDNVQPNTPIGEMAAGDNFGVLVSPSDRHGSPANVDCIDPGAFVNP